MSRADWIMLVGLIGTIAGVVWAGVFVMIPALMILGLPVSPLHWVAFMALAGIYLGCLKLIGRL